MLIVTDYTDSVSKILEIIHLLDSSYLNADLIELVNVKSNASADVVEDLRKIFGGAKDGNTGINFTSLDRMNSILVMANSKRALEEVKRWIGRLDAVTGRSMQTYVYTVENSTAANIALILSALYGGEGGEPAELPGTGAGRSMSGLTGGAMGSSTGGGLSDRRPPGFRRIRRTVRIDDIRRPELRQRRIRLFRRRLRRRLRGGFGSGGFGGSFGGMGGYGAFGAGQQLGRA